MKNRCSWIHSCYTVTTQLSTHYVVQKISRSFQKIKIKRDFQEPLILKDKDLQTNIRVDTGETIQHSKFDYLKVNFIQTLSLVP